MDHYIEPRLLDATQENPNGTPVTDEHISEIHDFFIQKQLIENRERSMRCIIAPVGLIGAGKTTMCGRIAPLFHLCQISTDSIRDYLLRRGHNLVRTSEIVSGIAKTLLDKGYGIIMDADCAARKQELTSLASQYSIPLAWIRVQTIEPVILTRLDEANSARAYKGEGAIDRYRKRKVLHTSLHTIPFLHTYRGDGDIEREIQLLSQSLRAFLHV